jgi:hypothetical protein
MKNQIGHHVPPQWNVTTNTTSSWVLYKQCDPYVFMRPACGHHLLTIGAGAFALYEIVDGPMSGLVLVPLIPFVMLAVS